MIRVMRQEQPNIKNTILKNLWSRLWDRNNLLKKTRLQIPKSSTLIMKPRNPYRKYIKTGYDAQFPTDLILNNEIEKEMN